MTDAATPAASRRRQPARERTPRQTMHYAARQPARQSHGVMVAPRSSVDEGNGYTRKRRLPTCTKSFLPLLVFRASGLATAFHFLGSGLTSIRQPS
jgi:hypothetical protein